MDVEAQRRLMRLTAASRPRQKRQGRPVEWKHCPGIELIGELADHLSAPFIERINCRLPFAPKPVEHRRPGIPNQYDELGSPTVLKRRHAVIRLRREPAERCETLPADGVQDRMFEHLTLLAVL